MFYSDTILARKGPLANIWLAAHWDRRLSKHQIMTANVTGSLNEVLSGCLPPMALRLSGQLLLGASKIYSRKAKYLLDDCTDALTRLRLTTSSSKDVDMPAEQIKASHAQITISKNLASAATAPLLDESFDLEGFLNESTAMAATTKAPLNAKLLNKLETKQGQYNHAVQPLSFGGDAGNDLLGEFAGMIGGTGFGEEIEVGRLQNNIAPRSSSITPEVGRLSTGLVEDAEEAEELKSLKDSLLNSPVYNTHADVYANDNSVDDVIGNQVQPLMSSPPSSIKRRKNDSTVGKQKRRRRLVLLVDDQTEISTLQFQDQLRDTAAIIQGSAQAELSPAVDIAALLNRPGALMGVGGQDLSGLFAATCLISSPITHKKSTTNPTTNNRAVGQDDFEFNDDGGFDLMHSLPPIPTSPVSLTAIQPTSSDQQSTVDPMERWSDVLRQQSVSLESVAKVLQQDPNIDIF